MKESFGFKVVKETPNRPVLKKENSFLADGDVDARKIIKTGVGPGGYPKYDFRIPSTKAANDSEKEGTSKKLDKLEAREAGWLNKKQRRQLRAILAAFGFTLMPMKDSNVVDVPSGNSSNAGNAHEIFKQASAFKEKNDEFYKEVKEMAKQIDDLDLNLTINYALKPVKNNEDYSRLEYAKQKVRFRSEPDEARGRPAVPDILQNELKRVIPGWIAQESRFKGDAVSSSNATGIAQIKPYVWESYMGTKNVSLSMEEQMKVFGELTSDNYHYIQHYAGEEVLEKLRSKFDSEEEFTVELMAPLMVNAYNAGGPMMGKVLKKFIESVPERKIKSGRDLFLQITDFARESEKSFSQEQEEYVQRVYAFTDRLSERGRG